MFIGGEVDQITIFFAMSKSLEDRPVPYFLPFEKLKENSGRNAHCDGPAPTNAGPFFFELMPGISCPAVKFLKAFRMPTGTRCRERIPLVGAPRCGAPRLSASRVNSRGAARCRGTFLTVQRAGFRSLSRTKNRLNRCIQFIHRKWLRKRF